jgi:hypothetical protein
LSASEKSLESLEKVTGFFLFSKAFFIAFTTRRGIMEEIPGGRKGETMDLNASSPHGGMSDRYQLDDIARGLRASLMAVLATALTGSSANFDYLRGVLALARSQAALYGIPWEDIVSGLHELPAFRFIETLQNSASACLEMRTPGQPSP